MAHEIIVLHDGTPQADVLEAECKNNPSVKPKVINVKAEPKEFEKYFEKLTDSDKKKPIYVPFTSEQFNEYNIDVQRNQFRSKFPDVNVFFAYEFMNNDGIIERGKSLGVEKVAEIQAGMDEQAGIEVEKDKDAIKDTDKSK